MLLFFEPRLLLLYLETNEDKCSDNEGWRTSFFMCNWKGISYNFMEVVQVIRVGWNP
jgi:hypothetical protein